MPAYADFTISATRGTDATFSGQIMRKGAPLNLTTWTEVALIVKKSAAETDTDAILNPTLTGGQFVLTNIAQGQYTVTIPKGATLALDNKSKTLFVEIRATDATGTQYIVSRGKLKVHPTPKPPKPFVPSQLSGLKLWVKGDLGLYQDAAATLAATDGSPVGAWKGTGAATHKFSQAAAGNRATKRAAALASLDVVEGNGTTSALSSLALSSFITADAFDLFMVAKATAGGSGAMTTWPAFVQDANQSIMVAVDAAGNLGLYNAESGTPHQVTTPYTLGQWALIEARHLNNGIGLTVDGGTEAGTASGATGNLTGLLWLFNTNAGAHPLAGQIAEIVLYNRGLTDPERAKVLGYLHARWGVPAFTGAPT